MRPGVCLLLLWPGLLLDGLHSIFVLFVVPGSSFKSKAASREELEDAGNFAVSGL